MSEPADKGVRLNRYLASCGVDSRRGVEAYIKQGRVEVNGELITDLSTRIFPNDHVKCDNKLLKKRSDLTIVLNKPKSFICTRSDPERRKTVYELLPNKFSQLNYVGRLDYQSTGLLILTSSGDLVESLTHPRYHIEKEYAVHLDHPLDGEIVPKLIEGINITEGLAKMQSVTFDTRRRLRVVLTQGYNRQIRRMFSRFDYKVKSLERIRIGCLEMPALSTGEYQILGRKEIELASKNPTKRK